MTHEVVPQTPGEADHRAPSSAVPVRKVMAGIIAWLGSSAGLAFLDYLGAAIPTEAVWGVVAGGAVSNLAAYMRRGKAAAQTG